MRKKHTLSPNLLKCELDVDRDGVNKMNNQLESVSLDEIANLTVQQKKHVLSKIVGSSRLYWGGHVANWAYTLGLIGVGAYYINESSWYMAPLCFFLGLTIWSYSEYFFHRWAYHGNHSYFAVGHLMHHDDQLALIGMPWMINMVLLVSLFVGATFIIGTVAAAFLFSGFWMGHIWYTIVHHAIHHWDFKYSWFRKLKHHHKIHHKLPHKNLGVTTMFWDRILKTSVKN